MCAVFFLKLENNVMYECSLVNIQRFLFFCHLQLTYFLCLMYPDQNIISLFIDASQIHIRNEDVILLIMEREYGCRYGRLKDDQACIHLLSLGGWLAVNSCAKIGQCVQE